MLKFSEANAKTKQLYKIKQLQKFLRDKRKVYSLDLPAGYSCPGARDCLSKCVGGKIQDGKHTQFRCFSASQEVTFSAVHKARMHNFDVLRTAKTERAIFKHLMCSLPKDAGIVRLHVSGDFFSFAYLQAIYNIAELYSHILFYGYTKSLHHVARIPSLDLSNGIVLPNFLLTASYGGTFDDLIYELNMRSARVIFEKIDDVVIDKDDSHAATPGPSFCLLLHGIQPKGTYAAKAWQIIRKDGGGYGK